MSASVGLKNSLNQPRQNVSWGIEMNDKVEMNDGFEDYLAAVYTLTLEGKTASATEICKHLGIAPAEVREMLKGLADSGYIDYSPHRGATLTDKGIEEFTFGFSQD